MSVTKPVVAFAANVRHPAAGYEITFTDQSLNTPTSWLWTFSDGQTSISQSPSITFAAEGPITVTLRATNASGFNTLRKINYIIVGAVVAVVIKLPVRQRATLSLPVPGVSHA